MSYRFDLALCYLGVVVPLACGHTSASPPSAAQGGKSLGEGGGAVAVAGATTAVGGAAAVDGTAGTTTSGSVAGGGGLGGSVTDPFEPSAGGAVEGGGAGSDGGAGAPSFPLEQPSCQALPLPCGEAQTSCCTTTEVPGGVFTRYDGNSATVSDFRLDKFEVTVGRFRAFVEHYPDDLPAPHSGKNPHDAQDTGWDPSYSAQLLPSSAALTAALDCSLSMATWDDEPAGDENRPINCITWYEAEAFCIWDGGRLPSDLEWEYAARGGAEGRHAPWGSAKEPSARTFAN
jgi:sulfatase modifying factor 1